MFFSVQSPFCFFCPFNKPSENIDLDEKTCSLLCKTPMVFSECVPGLEEVLADKPSQRSDGFASIHSMG